MQKPSLTKPKDKQHTKKSICNSDYLLRTNFINIKRSLKSIRKIMTNPKEKLIEAIKQSSQKRK